MTLTPEQLRAMHAKQKQGSLRGKTYKRKTQNVIVDYNKQLAYNFKGRRIGRFRPAKVTR